MKRTALVIGLTLLLAGCAPTPTYSADTAQDMQQRVLAVSEAAAQSDYAAAQLRIDELRVSAADALARGELTEARHGSITAALDLVQADIDAAVEAKRVAEALAAQQAEEARLAEEARIAEEARLAEEERQREEEEEEDDDRGPGRDKPKDED